MTTVYDDQETSEAPARIRPLSELSSPPRPNPRGAQVFGEDPGLYDRFRPGYPRELMETVVAGTGSGPVLEIGAGTGKATRALLALGRHVHVVEPDARMAAQLELNCGDGLTVTPTTLEAADLPLEGFALVVAAQSWHWVDPELGYARVSDALEPDGRLALLWHRPLPDQGLLGEAMTRLHAAIVPDLDVMWPGDEVPELDPPRDHVGASTRFRGWARHEHRWQRRLDSVGLVGWLCTSSAHRLLPVAQRFDLMSAVAALVEELGGEVRVEMRTVAHIGHRV